MPKMTRKEDRRKVNRLVAVERRGTGVERRRCEQCHGKLQTRSQRVKAGSVMVAVCVDCGRTTVSRQVDAHLVGDE